MPITVGKLGRLRAVDQRGPDVIFSFESSDLVLSSLLPNLIRHTWVPKHWRLYAERVIDGCAVRRRFWPADRAVTITETAEKIIVRMGDLLVEATRDPFHLRYAPVMASRSSRRRSTGDCPGPIGITACNTR